MNFKKAISLLASLSMAFSIVANASAATIKGDGYDIESGELEIVPKQSTNAAIIKAVTGSETAEDGYGVFQLDFNIKGIPVDCTVTQDENPLTGEITTSYTGIMIAAYSFAIDGNYSKVMIGKKATDVVVSDISENGVTTYRFGNGDGMLSLDKALPKTTTANDNYSTTIFTAFVYAPLGTVLHASDQYRPKVTVSLSDGSKFGIRDTYKLSCNDVTLGEKIDPPAVKKLGLTIDGTNAKQKGGYIWDVAVTNENVTVNKLAVEFVNDKGDKATREMQEAKTFFANFGGAGSTEFKLGLRTDRTGTVLKSMTATVGCEESDVNDASASWTAPVE